MQKSCGGRFASVMATFHRAAFCRIHPILAVVRGSSQHRQPSMETGNDWPQELGDLVDKTTVLSNETKCFERTKLPPARQLSNFPEPWETDVRWFLGFQAGKQVAVSTFRFVGVI